MDLNVTFFRSPVKDECIYEGASMPCGNNTMRGNLCAYIEGMTRVWTCSASDSMCWTFASDCSSDDTQRECSAFGEDWCCRSFETCTGRTDQMNICWAPWENPNENRSAPEALIYNQANFPVFPALSTSSAAEATATGPSTSEPTGNQSSTAASASPEASTASNSSLSLGSIIGIGIGCGVAVVAVAAGVGFVLLRKRMRGISRGPTQQRSGPDGIAAQRLELSNDRVAEIDDGRVKGWVSELPAGKT